MKRIVLMLGVLLMSAFMQGTLAQDMELVVEEEVTPVADERIKATLERLKIDFEEDEDCDYRIIVPIDSDGERTQLVFVNSNTEKFGGKLEIREIWSVGYKNDGSVPPALVQKAAKLSQNYIIGAWEVIGENRLAIVMKVPAVMEDELLRIAIVSVAQKADALEKDALGTDEL